MLIRHDTVINTSADTFVSSKERETSLQWFIPTCLLFRFHCSATCSHAPTTFIYLLVPRCVGGSKGAGVPIVCIWHCYDVTQRLRTVPYTAFVKIRGFKLYPALEVGSSLCSRDTRLGSIAIFEKLPRDRECRELRPISS